MILTITDWAGDRISLEPRVELYSVRDFMGKELPGLAIVLDEVSSTPEEAEEFLDICMAAVCKNIKEVKQYFEECGGDITGMTKKDLEEAAEVFKLPDGRYLVVDA